MMEDLRRCDVCHSTDLTESSRVDGYAIFCCKGCGLNKVHPTPTERQLEALYSGLDRKICKGAVLSEMDFFKKNPAQVIAILAPMRIEPLKRYFAGMNKDSAICDIGCGSGVFLAALRKLGYSNLYGIEFNSDSIRLIREELGFQTIVAGAVKSDRTIPPLDIITAYDVIEHLPKPSEAFQEMHRMLKAGGHLHVRVPNYGSLWAKLFGARWLWMAPPYHLNYFNGRSLQEIAVRSGFEIIQLRSRRSGYRLAFWALQLKRLTTHEVDSLHPASISKICFHLMNAAEALFRAAYLPVALTLGFFMADDCLELYAVKPLSAHGGD